MIAKLVVLKNYVLRTTIYRMRFVSLAGRWNHVPALKPQEGAIIRETLIFSVFSYSRSTTRPLSTFNYIIPWLKQDIRSSEGLNYITLNMIPSVNLDFTKRATRDLREKVSHQYASGKALKRLLVIDGLSREQL